jgi:putative Mg2+ transporter-C (MgtC) family protein
VFVGLFFLWFLSRYLFSHLVIFIISTLFSLLSRPAGIRTMSLVSLGSCLFTITSTFAFLSGPMSWDASRIAAAIPSGVGFLGAGLIFKKEQQNSDGSDPTPMVHGLTTAASLWLSAAVGIACGGELYFAASFGTATMMLLLRFGPRGDDSKHDDSDDEQEELERKMSDAAGGHASFQNGHESKSLLSLSARAKEKKLRQRANLASIV